MQGGFSRTRSKSNAKALLTCYIRSAFAFA
nr:MAG TPA: hypothetical protein [Caudoviricetes sp.]